MNLIFFGSPEFAVPSLEHLYHSKHKIHAVVTQPDRPSGRKLKLQSPAVKIAAQKIGLPVMQPETTKDPEFFRQISGYGADVLVVVAYGEILRRNLLELTLRGAINLHGSLLPKYRGAAPVAWAILQGETETGATTMQMNEKMDAGPIYLQSRCAINENDTAESLSRKISTLGAPLLVETIDLLERNAIQPQPQDPAEVTLAPKLTKEHGRIDWSKPAEVISRQIRAFDPWPGSFSSLGSIQLKFWKAYASDSHTEEPPGTIIQITKDDLEIACGDGSIINVQQIQPQNKMRLSAREFANGYHVQTGSRFDLPLIRNTDEI